MERTNAQAREIYFERQSLALCALHALNNVLQRQQFTKQSLNQICETLTPSDSLFSINPHKNMFGLGYFDINVIQYALQGQGHEVQWFDKRKPVQDAVNELLRPGALIGLIINYEYRTLCDKLLFTKSNHWLAIKVIGEQIYVLDSTNSVPKAFKDANEVVQYLQKIVNQNGNIFLIHEKKAPPECDANNARNGEQQQQAAQ